jgi:hypothetical protein
MSRSRKKIVRVEMRRNCQQNKQVSGLPIWKRDRGTETQTMNVPSGALSCEEVQLAGWLAGKKTSDRQSQANKQPHCKNSN